MGCIQLNLSKPPFNNLKMRQAMAYATSSEQYVKVIDNGVNPTIERCLHLVVARTTCPTTATRRSTSAKAKQLVSEVKASGGSRLVHPRAHAGPQGQPDRRVPPAGAAAGRHGRSPSVPILQDSIINVALTGAYQALTWRQFGAVNPDLNYIFWTPTNAEHARIRHQHGPQHRPGHADRAASRGASRPTTATQVTAYQQVNRLLSQDIPYVWYDRTVWAIGAHVQCAELQQPDDAGRQQGLRHDRRSHLAPADLDLLSPIRPPVRRRPPCPLPGGAVVS